MDYRTSGLIPMIIEKRYGYWAACFLTILLSGVYMMTWQL
jgi:hypothetical protein